MNVELLYLYIGENNTPVKNLDICFSHEYKIKYENKKLHIDKKKEYPYKNFYGKHVKSCSLIVGKNGSGKTTLLNFLGLTSMNLNRYYNLKDEKKSIVKISRKKTDYNDLGCWFALYTVDNQFYIEGYNYQRLFGQDFVNDLPISLNFSLFIDYSYETKTFNPINFANSYTKPNVDFFYYKRLPKSSISDFEFQEDTTIYNDDYTSLRLFRREIMNANINHIYSLFGDYSESLFEKNFAKKAQIKIEIKELDYDSTQNFDENIQLKFNYSNTKKVENLKEVFISNLYYSLAFGLWNAYCRNKNFNNLLPINSLTESKIIEREIALYYQELIRKKLKKNIPNYIKELDEFVENLYNVDRKHFFSGVKIEIPLTYHNIAIQKLLDCFYKNTEENGLNEIMEIKYTNLSSGEHEYIEVFGSLIKMLSEIESGNICKDRVLIFDEPDRTFHPEWTSKYISNLLRILYSFGEKKGISFQIIISTHSPFMVSDILNHDIYKIESSNDVRKIVKSEFGFASNYYDIMKDSFFLTSSVGHFAKEKIDMISRQIENAQTINELDKNINLIIDAIGDTYIRKILISKYYKKLSNLKNLINKSSIKERIDEKEKELSKLKELLKENE